MGKWNTNNSDPTLPYVVVLMCSRHKDNKGVPNFKKRRASQFCTYNKEKLYKEFNNFVAAGVPGEMSRLYISLNARDTKKVRKTLLIELINKEDFNFDNLQSIVATIAARKENAIEKKWFFDFDSKNPTMVMHFLKDIISIDSTLIPTALRTPNGYAVIVEHRFDTRELLRHWGEVASLKRDDLICEAWRRNEV